MPPEPVAVIWTEMLWPLVGVPVTEMRCQPLPDEPVNAVVATVVEPVVSRMASEPESPDPAWIQHEKV